MSILFSLSNAAIDVIPIGCILPHVGSSVPNTNYLLCDGSAFSTSTYPVLFGMLGSANTPDLRNKSVFGNSSYPAGISYGGSENATLAANNLPVHTHNATTAYTSAAGGHAHSTDAQGGHGHSTWTHNHSHIYSIIGEDWFGCNSGDNRSHNNGFSGQLTSPAGGHSHNVNWGGAHSHPQVGAAGAHAHNFTTDNNITNTSAFNIIPPFYTINWIIKARN